MLRVAIALGGGVVGGFVLWLSVELALNYRRRYTGHDRGELIFWIGFVFVGGLLSWLLFRRRQPGR